MTHKPTVSIIGDGTLPSDSPKAKLAEDLGRALVDAGYRIVCGGKGGIMEAAGRGARSSEAYETGDLVGILPTTGFPAKTTRSSASTRSTRRWPYWRTGPCRRPNSPHLNFPARCVGYLEGRRRKRRLCSRYRRAPTQAVPRGRARLFGQLRRPVAPSVRAYPGGGPDSARLALDATGCPHVAYFQETDEYDVWSVKHARRHRAHHRPADERGAHRGNVCGARRGGELVASCRAVLYDVARRRGLKGLV